MDTLKSVRMAEEFLEGGDISLRQIDTQVHLEKFKFTLEKWSCGSKLLKVFIAPILVVGTILISANND